MDGAVLYSLHFAWSFQRVLFAAIPAALIAATLAVLVYNVRKRKSGKGVKRSVIAFNAVCAAFAVFAGALSWISAIASYESVAADYRSGDVVTVEGTVEKFTHVTPKIGTYYEGFYIGDTEFYYGNDPVNIPGFCENDGIIYGGEKLRVTYVPAYPFEDRDINCIVKIEKLD
jgi:hypothetical protein